MGLLGRQPTKKMVATVTAGIAKMKKALAAENMPPDVTIAFVERVRKATGTLTDKTQLQCSAAKSAGDLQDMLGPKAILRGHPHTAWVEAIHIPDLLQTSVPFMDC